MRISDGVRIYVSLPFAMRGGVRGNSPKLLHPLNKFHYHLLRYLPAFVKIFLKAQDPFRRVKKATSNKKGTNLNTGFARKLHFGEISEKGHREGRKRAKELFLIEQPFGASGRYGRGRAVFSPILAFGETCQWNSFYSKDYEFPGQFLTRHCRMSRPKIFSIKLLLDVCRSEHSFVS